MAGQDCTRRNGDASCVGSGRGFWGCVVYVSDVGGYTVPRSVGLELGINYNILQVKRRHLVCQLSMCSFLIA